MKVKLIISVVVLIVLSLVSLMVGSQFVALGDLFSGIFEENKFTFVLFQLRLPRTLTALFAGAALAISGLLMQSYFRNALAGPYILGISSGSGLGVATFIMLGSILGLNFSSVGNGIMIFSILGAALILLLVMILAAKIGNGTMLLITGLMIGSFASALVSVFQYFAPSETIKKYLLWTMGSLSSVELSEFWLFGLLIFLGIAGSFMLGNSMNAMLLGSEQAQSLGVDPKKVKWLVLVVSGILAGVVTAYCGPIAFIGLAAPHIAKLLIKTSDHLVLIPFVVLIGAILLLFCDILAQVPGVDILLPINAVTSIIGAPVVVAIILKNGKNLASE